jgi:transcriptional regulator with XRE-family HTH domain
LGKEAPEIGGHLMPTRRPRFAGRRKAVGFSQEQLAERLGIDRSTVVRWESGETEPQPWIRPRLARALQLSLEQLDHLLAGGDSEPLSGRRRPAGAGTRRGIDRVLDPAGILLAQRRDLARRRSSSADTG